MSKGLGVLVPLFSLPNEPERLAGDLGTPAHEWIDLMSEWNAENWLLLPLAPGRIDRWFSFARVAAYTCNVQDVDRLMLTALSVPKFWFDKCPYTPNSAFALNSIYASIEGLKKYGLQVDIEIPKYPIAPSVHANMAYSWMLKNKALGQCFQTLFNPLIEDSRFMEAVTKALEGHLLVDLENDKCIYSFMDTQSTFEVSYLKFLNQHGPLWLTQYAFFEVHSDLVGIKELRNNNFSPDYVGFCEEWPKWSADLRSGGLPDLIKTWKASGSKSDLTPSFAFGDEDVVMSFNYFRSILYHTWVQFVLFDQLADLREYGLSKGVKLIGDVPIYLPMQSADCWSNPSVFSIDKDIWKPASYGGTPPDYWSEGGQLWGTPTYDWTAPETKMWWEQRLVSTKKQFPKIRIDHFRAFADAWTIPRAWAETHHNGSGGHWNIGPGFAFFQTLIEKHGTLLDPSDIIVEDLGEDTTALQKMRSEMTFPRMVVFQFDIDDVARHVCKERASENLSSTSLESATKATDSSSSDEKSSELTCPTCANTWIGGQPSFSFVAFTGTHDNPPLLEWYENINETTKHWLENAVGRVPMRSPQMPKFLIQWLFTKIPRGSTLIVTVQDLLCLGRESRVNYPGQMQPDMWSWQMSSAQIASLQAPTFCKWLRSIHV